jgi:hypothetical protein
MTDARFATLTVTVARLSRRLALGGALAVVDTAPWQADNKAAAAKHKRKRKRRKNKRKAQSNAPVLCPPPLLSCPASFEACGGVCCAPEKTCVSGVCQCKTACGAVCCLNGQLCLDEDTSTCGCTVGTCPTGCNCGGAAGGIRTCYSSVILQCEGLQPCTSNLDCPAGTGCALICGGAFCFPLCGS